MSGDTWAWQKWGRGATGVYWVGTGTLPTCSSTQDGPRKWESSDTKCRWADKEEDYPRELTREGAVPAGKTQKKAGSAPFKIKCPSPLSHTGKLVSFDFSVWGGLAVCLAGFLAETDASLDSRVWLAMCQEETCPNGQVVHVEGRTPCSEHPGAGACPAGSFPWGVTAREVQSRRHYLLWP